jgi:FkbM family methyltransferase
MYVKFVRFFLNTLEDIFYSPKIELALQNLKKSLKEPIVIFDVGANRGQSAIRFRRLFANADIYCFEPNPSTFALLCKLKLEKIHKFNFAVGSFIGKTKFYCARFDETSTQILPKLNSKREALKRIILFTSKKQMYKEIEVEIYTLERIVFDLNIQSIFLLKIDVEGAEMDVLVGAKALFEQNRVQHVQLERHEDDLRSNERTEIETFLSNHNFTISSSIKHPSGKIYDDIYSFCHSNKVA